MSLGSRNGQLGLLFLAALALRIASFTVPGIEDLGLRDLGVHPYKRALHFADAVQNVQDGRGPVLDKTRVNAHARLWREGPSRLPPLFDPGIARGEPEWTSYFDEKGYLLLMLGLHELRSGTYWKDVLVVQAVLSAAAAVGVAVAVHALLGHAMLALLAGWIYALHPLEILLSRLVDHPVWAVYAVVAGLLLAAVPWPARRRGGGVAPALLGAFLGLCVVHRVTNGATALVALVALAWPRRSGTGRLVGAATAGLLLAVVGLGAVPLGQPAIGDGAPAVGRSAFYHTLLGGLSEFGDIEGLEWLDRSMHAYLKERYGVEKLTPAYNDAAREEYHRVLEARPLLPLQVAAKRVAFFLVAYRPERSPLPVVLGFGAFKVALVVGCVMAWRRMRSPEGRRRVEGSVAVGLAPIAVHVIIVPLIVVYIAPFLVVGTVPAVLGPLVLLHEARRRLGTGGG